MFTNEQLTSAINAYGTTASAHVARLIALADMRAVKDATIDDIATAIRHAAACAELGKPFDDTSAATLRAVDRLVGYSDSTFARYGVVLDWLAVSLGDKETLTDILAGDSFTPEALSALCQLASGKVAPRKVAADTVAPLIAKRDSKKIVAAYRRLLAANKAKTESKNRRNNGGGGKGKSPKTPDTPPAPERTPEEILSELSLPAMAELLAARIASSLDDLSPNEYASLVDTLAGISAMLEEPETD